MKHTITNLNLIKLNDDEFGAVIYRIFTDMEAFSPDLITDPILTAYMDRLNAQCHVYLNSTSPIRQHALTETIVATNKTRNTAIRQLRQIIQLASESVETDEQESGETLMMLLKPYDNIRHKSYSAKSFAIDNLLEHLSESKYAPLVGKLNIDRYVTRLQAINDEFKQYFDRRMGDMAKKEHVDVRALRAQLADLYREVMIYVQAMANATDHEQYVKMKFIINAGRKNFANLLARRKGLKASAKAKKDASLIAVDESQQQ